MRVWDRFLVPAMAAMAVALLGAAGASGIDEMASARITPPASPAAGGQPSLRHLILLGLARGSLPGGLPYDDLREEEYEETYPEAGGAATPGSA